VPAARCNRGDPKDRQAGRRPPGTMSLQTGYGRPMASPVVKNTRSRRRRTAPRLDGKRLRNIRLRWQGEGIGAGPIETDCIDAGALPPPGGKHQPVAKKEFRRTSCITLVVRHVTSVQDGGRGRNAEQRTIISSRPSGNSWPLNRRAPRRFIHIISPIRAPPDTSGRELSHLLHSFKPNEGNRYLV